MRLLQEQGDDDTQIIGRGAVLTPGLALRRGESTRITTGLKCFGPGSPTASPNNDDAAGRLDTQDTVILARLRSYTSLEVSSSSSLAQALGSIYQVSDSHHHDSQI